MKNININSKTFSLIISVVLLFLCSTILSCLSPWYLGAGVGEFINGNASKQPLLIFVSLFLLSTLLGVFSSILSNKIQATILANMQTRIGTRLFSLPLEKLATAKKGELSSLILSDSRVAATICSASVLKLPASIVQLIVCLCCMIWLDLLLTAILLISLLVLVISSVILGKIVQTKSTKIQQAYAEQGQYVERYVGNILFCQAYQLTKELTARFTSATSLLKKESVKLAQTTATFNAVNNIFLQVMILGIFAIGALRVQSGAINAGHFATFGFFVFLFSSPVNNFTSAWSGFMTAKAALQRLSPWLKDTHLPAEKHVAPTPNQVESLQLNQLSFCYENAQNPCLTNLTIDLPKTGIIGVTGESGAGKTTLLLLISGLLHPTGGTIAINGSPVTAQQLQNLVCLVPQQVPLWGGSLRESLTLNQVTASDERLLALLADTGLAEFVKRLPAGLDSPLSEVIGLSSGGQLQRLAVIRGILQNKPVLVLDEPTSSLDTESEEKIMQLLTRYAKQHLVILSTHRQTPIQQCSLALHL